jgi:hypothetical protein
MSQYSGAEETEFVELMVTVKFGVLTTVDDTGPREQALVLRDRWVEDPAQMVEYLGEIGDEFDLVVKTPSEP